MLKSLISKRFISLLPFIKIASIYAILAIPERKIINNPVTDPPAYQNQPEQNG